MPKISEFRNKITLCRLLKTTDSELNRTETIQPTKEVWANVTVKRSNVDTTTASTRPEIHYEIVIRKQNITCDCVIYKGKTLYLTEPWYEYENKYIIIRAGEIDGKFTQ